MDRLFKGIKKMKQKYEFGTEYFKKAKTYSDTVDYLKDAGILDESTLVLNEVAMENYLAGLLELEINEPISTYYGMGKIPHDLGKRYKDLYLNNNNKILPNYDRNLWKELNQAYHDYCVHRFPRDDFSCKFTNDTILYDISLKDDLKKMVEEYCKKYELSNEKDNIEIEKE